MAAPLQKQIFKKRPPLVLPFTKGKRQSGFHYLKAICDWRGWNNDPHPYWYTCIIGIFHANIHHIGPESTSWEPIQMDFLFVCWFGCNSDPQPGWKSRRLIWLGFIPGNDGSDFGFLDPNQVIRGIPLIPDFHWGQVTKYLPRLPIAHGNDNPDHDWQLFYIGMYIFKKNYLLVTN